MNNRMILKNNSNHNYIIKRNKKILKLFLIFFVGMTLINITKLIVNNVSNYFLKNSVSDVIQLTSSLINYSVTDDMLDDLDDVTNVYHNWDE